MMRDPKPSWKSCFWHGAKMSTYVVGGAALVGIPFCIWLMDQAGAPRSDAILMIKLWMGVVGLMWFLMLFNFAGQARGSDGPNVIEHKNRLAFIPFLVRRVEKMVQGGSVELHEPFDAFTWTMKWLAEPCPALGGPPIGYINSPDGRKRILQVLDQMESGVYA